MFCSHEINLEKSDLALNVFTKKVLPEGFNTEFLEIEREQRKLQEQFIEERIVESKSIQDTINKRKLPTFANNKKMLTVKIRNQIFNIKAERKLMSRFTEQDRDLMQTCLTILESMNFQQPQDQSLQRKVTLFNRKANLKSLLKCQSAYQQKISLKKSADSDYKVIYLIEWEW